VPRYRRQCVSCEWWRVAHPPCFLVHTGRVCGSSLYRGGFVRKVRSLYIRSAWNVRCCIDCCGDTMRSHTLVLPRSTSYRSYYQRGRNVGSRHGCTSMRGRSSSCALFLSQLPRSGQLTHQHRTASRLSIPIHSTASARHERAGQE